MLRKRGVFSLVFSLAVAACDGGPAPAVCVCQRRALPACGQPASDRSHVGEAGVVVEEGQPDAPVIKLLQSVFEDAVQVSASDIHIEPDETVLRVRLRIDGELQEQVIEGRLTPADAVEIAKMLSAGKPGDWERLERELSDLVGCTVAPGFEFAAFEMAEPGWEPAGA